MTKSITRRMLVAGALVGTVLATLPSRANVGTTLEVISTSVDGGFASVNPIAARFTLGLDATASNGTLTDRTGTTVASVVRRISSGSGPDGDSLLLTPNLSALNELLSPYTVTFNAVQAVTGTATPQTLSVVRNFYLDLRKPSVAITTPSSSGTLPRLVAPGESLTVAGHAYDDFNYDTVAGTLIARTANRSGLASVEIKYYKLNPAVRSLGSVNPGPPPTVTPPVIQPSQEVATLRHNATLSECTRAAACVADEQAWTANTSGLDRGSWTLQAVSIDKAGNRSAVAETSFIIV